MKIPFILKSSPYDRLSEHAEKIKECMWSFQQTIECRTSKKCIDFDNLRAELKNLIFEAEEILLLAGEKILKEKNLPFEQARLLLYLREQSNVLEAIDQTISWISYRATDKAIPKELEKNFNLLVDSIVETVEEMTTMAEEAGQYFKKPSPKRKKEVSDTFAEVRKKESEADKMEDELKMKLFELDTDPTTLLHVVKLAETIGAIADHAEKAAFELTTMII